MILQALAQHYEDLLKCGEIAAPGWGPAKISYALCLNKNGELTNTVFIEEEKQQGKKSFFRPQEIILPSAVKRSSGIASNFLWDNSTYLLGIDKKGKPQRSRECFAAAAALHHSVLDDVDSPIAKAILAFFDNWQPDNAARHPAICNQLDEITSGKNLVFYVNGCYSHKDDMICNAWQQRFDCDSDDVVRMQCLVTGKVDEIASIHPSIKGVRGAQSSGAALVSFNAPAFCSYGHEQNYNSPVSKHAAFAYTAALNYLLADKNSVKYIGDTTIVCWAEETEPIYQEFSMAVLCGSEKQAWTDDDLRAAIKNLADGVQCDDLGIDPNRTFYILGLVPNSARISVRFFYRNTFGNLMKNINKHYEQLEIARPSCEKYKLLPLLELIQEAVNPAITEKSISNTMAGSTVRAVFSGEPYPKSLLTAVMLRIRATQNITWGQAAILKAYLKRNIISQQKENSVIKEAANVNLNEECTYMPYILGRLFYIMEQTQLASADWKINRSIKDSYFNAAAMTPRNAFAKLFPLHEHHMKKLMRDKTALAVKYNKIKAELSAKITSSIPARFTQEESICFYIGYYHQSVYKKEENENV